MQIGCAFWIIAMTGRIDRSFVRHPSIVVAAIALVPVHWMLGATGVLTPTPEMRLASGLISGLGFGCAAATYGGRYFDVVRMRARRAAIVGALLFVVSAEHLSLASSPSMLTVGALCANLTALAAVAARRLRNTYNPGCAS
jgi:hypothetical protein